VRIVLRVNIALHRETECGPQTCALGHSLLSNFVRRWQRLVWIDLAGGVALVGNWRQIRRGSRGSRGDEGKSPAERLALVVIVQRIIGAPGGIQLVGYANDRGSMHRSVILVMMIGSNGLDWSMAGCRGEPEPDSEV